MVLIKGEELSENIHYQKLNHPRWKYVTTQDIQVDITEVIVVQNGFTLYYGNRELARLSSNGILTISKNYAWDGASSICPDKGYMLASLIHDVLYQASGCVNFPLSRKQCDKIFRDFSVSVTRDLAYNLLRLGGWNYFGKWDPKLELLKY